MNVVFSSYMYVEKMNFVQKNCTYNVDEIDTCRRFSYVFVWLQGGDSQNFLHKFVRFFVTSDLKILRLIRLKVLLEADIIKGWC